MKSHLPYFLVAMGLIFTFLLSLWPLVKEKWPLGFKIIAVISAAALAVLLLLFKPLTGVSLEDYAGNNLARVTCSLIKLDGCERVGVIQVDTNSQEEGKRAAEAAKRAEENLRIEQEKQKDIERKHKADKERQELEAERRRQEEAEQKEKERKRLADEERRRLEAERRRQEEEERRRLEEERRRQEQKARNSRWAATAVGRVMGSSRLYAFTEVDQTSAENARSKALSRCESQVTECKILVSFSGAGRCVFVAAGGGLAPGYYGPRRIWGARVGRTPEEAVARCSERYPRCQVFHSRCNSQ